MFRLAQVPTRARRALMAPLLAAALLILSAGAAAGRVASEPDPPGIATRALTGYDISYPQCRSTFPKDVWFAIVGVTGGRSFTANPCLGKGGSGPSELEWAGQDAGFYMNTGNPGPQASSHWPSGQMSPKPCNTQAHPGIDSWNCSYDYGWASARDAYSLAVKAYVSLGWAPSGSTRTPVANEWWLDVETANSWRNNTSLNVAALRGAAEYLKYVGATSVGFYSVSGMWSQITGGTTFFAAYPSWVAGASTLRGAKINCTHPAFNGGSVVLTQYFSNGFDADYRC